MDRQIVYIGQSPQDTDMLLTNKDAYIGLAKLSAAVLGTSTLLNGFTCIATSPASLAVSVTAGEIYSLQNIDNTAYGSLAPDTTHQIVKQGVVLGTTTPISTPAPGTVGFSINYLIQIGFSELDGGSVVLPYYDSANPSVPFTGPNNNPVPQNTIRADGVTIQAKAGTAATTGTQTTPTADAGFVGAFVVTVAQGQTTVTSGNISTYATAPFITETLTNKLGVADFQSGAAIFGIDAGTANTYVVPLTPAITAYTEGMSFNILISNASTGASTLNINSVGAVAIQYTSGNAIKANDLLANGIYNFIYTGSVFQLRNPSSEDAGGVLPASEGGTGVSNPANWTNAGAVTFSGSYSFTATLTNTTSITFPVSGTIISTTNGAALTTSNDTNITLTTGGSASTALANAASITVAWTGLLSPSRGGLGISTVPSNGFIPIGNGTNYTAAALTPGQNINITNGSGSITVANTIADYFSNSFCGGV